ncbi:MAG: hypothetical protein ABIK98_01790 [Pseudomonadota bacterium]|uniref:DUF106 domain-containing protein n=1 Tax=Candidatus Desulfatibia profunda TaxID=2841695 RepID=A0A8J6TG91_9BACT|nr:hypothetical protein [Candidatus Desulfatibia profunda]MBL7179632.1 hypothetical protein [Desulfobacterales bacterium]MBU0699497.1 hypothetical protein [Pseudomonadota bacterium]
MNIDGFLIYFYRIVEEPIIGYFIGTGVLSLLCVIIGEFTISVAFRFNKAYIDQDSREMVRMQNLSVRALLAKDKKSYKAFNREANEAFGKVFFKQIALASASLWPIPFALGWMQTRFFDIEFLLPCRFPVVGETTGYAFTFIPMYILVRLLFGKIKPKLPYFKTTEKMLASYDGDSDKMTTLADLTDASQNSKESGTGGPGFDCP